MPAENLIGTEGRGLPAADGAVPAGADDRRLPGGRLDGAGDGPATASYLGERQAFGGPLYANDYLAYTLAELSAEVDLLKHYNHACAEAFVAGADTKRMVAIAKLTAGRLLRQVADLCLQFHGGLGYMEEHWTARVPPRTSACGPSVAGPTRSCSARSPSSTPPDTRHRKLWKQLKMYAKIAGSSVT